MQIISVELRANMIRIYIINNKGQYTCIDDRTHNYVKKMKSRRKLFIEADDFFHILKGKGIDLDQVFSKCAFLSKNEQEYLKLKWL